MSAQLTNFVLQRQMGNNLCWAAVTQAVVKKLRDQDLEQCKLAAQHLGGATINKCCQLVGGNVPDNDCDQGFSVLSALRQHLHGAASAIELNDHQSFGWIETELGNQRPVVVILKLLDSDKEHTVVLHATNSLEQTVSVANPLDPDTAEEVSYTEFRDAYQGAWSWVRTVQVS